MTNNRLRETKSLYLRKHAENPINWQFWSEEALAKAKNDNKPIFLSIGYSSCHWCTVMEGEAFSDWAISKYINDNFIAIKVDREERPDLDSIYMQSLQMMTGQGGWPLNIFISPDDLVPFYGGTYFPVEPRYGRPGFLELLTVINDFYHNQKDKLEDFKQGLLEALNQSIIMPSNVNNLDQNLLKKGIKTNTAVLNRNDLSSPRFPMIPYANLTLQGCLFNFKGDNQDQKLANQRGKDLVNGGIYDHVGGGFHRYTVDATWTIPHFEKMLYDNGLILEFLANLWSFGFQESAYQTSCYDTLQWLKREMTADKGYFYCSQDADNFDTKEDFEPEEGAFYVWSYLELKEVLSTEELEALKVQFTISENGNFDGKNVLQRQDKIELLDIVKTALKKLFKVRYGAENITKFTPARNNEEAKNINWLGRIPPVTDTKMIAAWNGLMISGLARCYGVFKDQNYLDSAVNCVDFIINNQWENNRFYRLNYDGEISILAQAEDYTLLIKSLLDLHHNNPTNNRWLEMAIAIQSEFHNYFWCIESGGYYNNSSDNNNDLLIKERSYIDNAIYSTNGIAITNLMRLFLLTDDQEYLHYAEEGLKTFSVVMDKSPVSCPTLFVALDWYLNGKVVKSNTNLIQDLIPLYLPTTVLKIVDNLPNEIVAIVCQGLSCLEGVKTKEELLNQLKM